MRSFTRNERQLPKLICALLALVMLLAGCSDAVGQEGPGFEPGASIDYPTGSNDVILRIEEIDVYSLLGDATEVPLLTLYGDGTLIVLDRQADATASGLPSLERYRLSDEGIRVILGEAQLAGLYVGDQRYAGPYEDVPVTKFTVSTNASTSVTRVDGLHVTDPDDIPADEREDRQQLSELVALTYDIDSRLTDEHIVEPGVAFEAERLQFVSLPDDTPAQASDPIWPLAIPLTQLIGSGSDFGYGGDLRCFELNGADAKQFAAALGDLGSSGRTGTTWQDDGQLFYLYVRPLLPDQQACQ